MSRMTMDLSPQLLECLTRIEKIVGKKSKIELVFEALLFYEDILKRALSTKKLRLVEYASPSDFEAKNKILSLDPTIGQDSGSRREKQLGTLEERMRLAGEVGLIPKR